MFKKLVATRKRRFLFGGFLCLISGWVMLFVASPFLVSPIWGITLLLVFAYGFIIAMSFIEKAKCKYIDRYHIFTKKFGKLTFILVQAHFHAYAPFISFICPYYYLTYKKEYYLVWVEEEPDAKLGEMLSGDYINEHARYFSKETYNEFIANPLVWLYHHYDQPEQEG